MEYIPQLAALLSRDDKWIALEAVEALGKLKAASCGPQIASLLRSSDSRLVCAAAEALGEMGAVDYADQLAGLISHNGHAVRTAAMWALSKIGDRRCVDIAMEILFGASASTFVSDDYAQLCAFQVLEKSGDRNLIPRIVPFLEHESDFLRHSAVKALGVLKAHDQSVRIATMMDAFPEGDAVAIRALYRLGAKEYTPRIAAKLKNTVNSDASESTAVEAIKALARFEATEYLPDIEAFEKKEKPGRAKAVAAGVLMHMKKESPGSVSSYSRELTDLDWASCKAFLDLAETGFPECVEPMMGFIGRWYEYSAVANTLRQLGWQEMAARREEIASLLRSKNDLVSMGAVLLLREMHADNCTPEIARLLAEERSADLIIQALVTLVQFKATNEVESILGLAKSNQNTYLRVAALGALAHLEGRRLIPALGPLLASSEPYEVRWAALACLYSFDAPELEKAAVAILHDETAEPALKLYALEKLSKRNPLKARQNVTIRLGMHEPNSFLLQALNVIAAGDMREAGPMVAELLKHPDSEIREQALETLVRLGATEEAEAIADLLEQQPDDSRYPDPHAGTLPALGALKAIKYVPKVLALIDSGTPEEIRTGISVLADMRAVEKMPLLFPYLPDAEKALSLTAAEALMKCGNIPEEALAFLCEATVTRPELKGTFLFAAHFLYEQNENLRPALVWLGGRAGDEHPEFPESRGTAKTAVTALQRVWRLAEKSKQLNARRQAMLIAIDLIQAAVWSPADAGWLDAVAGEFSDPDLEAKAGRIKAMAQQIRERDPVYLALQAAPYAPVAWAALWALLLAVYPFFMPARWVLWNRWTRRIAGLGIVGPLVVRVPFLRNRIWRPFRDSLVPPVEIQTFDEWLFFDTVKMSPVAAEGETVEALPAILSMKGMNVLEGLSGLGKTTLLQAAVIRASNPVALLHATECAQGILAALQQRLPPVVQKDARFLRALVLRGSPAIFVDGVQEAPPAVQARLAEEVNAMSGATVLLATQPTGWKPPKTARVWRLVPLSNKDIASFLLKHGAIAIETREAGPSPEKWAGFMERAQRLLAQLESQADGQQESPAVRRMLSNPMDARLAAEVMAGGETPIPDQLLKQRMQPVHGQYEQDCGEPFPAAAFADHLVAQRLLGAPAIDMTGFEKPATCLAKERLLRKAGDGWRFRHDKLMDWFLRPAFENAALETAAALKADSRFSGVEAIPGS
ncbi:MAG TPA: HEAT repeat domain-containing protein [Verrucomicrobiales bacterium]|nr:HEAT repeat domain-containing protein [Verrucomicrobiales bacterium]